MFSFALFVFQNVSVPTPPRNMVAPKPDPHSFAAAPRNVTMNVKDLPAMPPGQLSAVAAVRPPQLPQDLLANVAPSNKVSQGVVNSAGSSSGQPKTIDLSSLGGGQKDPPPNITAPASAPIPSIAPLPPSTSSTTPTKAANPSQPPPPSAVAGAVNGPSSSQGVNGPTQVWPLTQLFSVCLLKDIID